MQNTHNYYNWKSIIPIITFIILSNTVTAQVDTVKASTTDTAATHVDTTTTPEAKSEKKKRKDEFIIYGGANINHINASKEDYDANSSVGYHFGIAYKRGTFFYWQIGARYNSMAYNFAIKSTGNDTAKLTVTALDLPVTAGINFLSFVNRLIALRVFLSAVPSFNLNVNNNNLNINKDDINSFIFYGQGGIGVNVAFLVIEFGYNYGFQDLLKNYSNSHPGQAFASIGFRF
jgi:hypothetical protein